MCLGILKKKDLILYFFKKALTERNELHELVSMQDAGLVLVAASGDAQVVGWSEGEDRLVFRQVHHHGADEKIVVDISLHKCNI